MLVSCPKCDSELYYRPGKWGAFYSCKNYPKCSGKMSVKDVWLKEKKALILRERENKKIQKAARAIANMHNIRGNHAKNESI